MTRQVLFNGAVLIRAGGATKVDASAFQNLGLGGVGNVGIIGEADGGEPNAVTLFRSPRAGVAAYRAGPLADAMDIAFLPMNDTRVPGGANLVLAYKANQAAQASGILQKSGNNVLKLTSRDYGVHTNKIRHEVSTSGGGKVLELTFEDGADISLSEASAALGASEEFTLQYTGDATTALLTISPTHLYVTLAGDQTDGSADLAFAFTDYPTLNDLINVINLQTGYVATAVTKNPYTFQPGWLDRVTAQACKASAYAAYAVLHRMVEWVTNNSELVSPERQGPGVAASGGSITCLAKAALANNDKFTIPDGVKSVPFEFQVDGTFTPTAGHVTIDIQAATTDEEVAALVAPVVTNLAGFFVDAAVDGTVAAKVNFTNNIPGSHGNQTITEVLAAGTLTPVALSGGTDLGHGAPDDGGPTALSGGLRGVSANSDWQSGFDALGKVRCNEVVPLISQDLTNEGNGSTATFASVAAMGDAHAGYYSSTKGKSERQCYLGMKGTKTELLDQAGLLQSPHTCLTGQRITRPNAASDMVSMDEWAMAVVMAGGRAGSLLGEPLVYKNIRAYGLTQDDSWNPEDDGEDMVLGGVTFAFAPPNQGFKFDRVITTYTKLDNDAYVEESVVMGWKNVAYELRTQLEAIFTGVRGLPATITAIKDAASRILESFRKEGQIVDSILEDGTVLRAYRELEVILDGDIARLNVVVSPVSGINFQLQTLFLVPATIAA